MFLREPLSYQPCFISFNGAIWTRLQLVHPFTSNNFSVLWQFNQFPNFVLFKGFHFLLHGIYPFILFRTLSYIINTGWLILQHINSIGFYLIVVWWPSFSSRSSKGWSCNAVSGCFFLFILSVFLEHLTIIQQI